MALILRVPLLKCGRKYAYYLWIAVFLNLALPFAPQGEYSLIPRQVAKISVTGERTVGAQGAKASVQPLKTKAATGDDTRTGGEGGSAGGQKKSVQPEKKAVDSQPFVSGENELSELPVSNADVTSIVRQVTEIVWLVGLTLLVLFNVFHTVRLKKMISKKRWASFDEGNRIAEVTGLAAPFLWGIFRPVIYLPTGLDPEEKKYIIAHESCHRKRKDSLCKIAVFAVTALHWINPLVWAAWALFCRDMEASCDEAVLEAAGGTIKKEYASSLLKYAASQSGYLMTPVTFGEPSVKARIKNVLRYRKRNVLLTAAAAFAVAVAAFGITVHPGELGIEPQGVALGVPENVTGEQRRYYVEDAGGLAQAGIYSRAEGEKEPALLLAGDFELLWEDEARLYVSRREAEGLFIDSVRKVNGYVESDLMGQAIKEPEIFSFYANESYLVYAAGETDGSLGLTNSMFYSYDRKSGALKERYVTDAPGFAGVIKGNVYYQKYWAVGEEDNEKSGLYRMDLAFLNEVQVGEGLSFLLWDEADGSLFAAKASGEQNGERLVRVDLNGQNERTFFDTASLNWESEAHDKFVFRDVERKGEDVLFRVEQWGYRGEDGYRDTLIRYAQILAKSDDGGYEKVAEEAGNLVEAVAGTEIEEIEQSFRRQAYISALEGLMEQGISPDEGDWKFTLYDIDFDGKDELIFDVHGSISVSRDGYRIYDYEEETGNLVEMLRGPFYTTFYNNGVVKVSFYPDDDESDVSYSLYQYEREKEEYVCVADVSKWDGSILDEDLDGSPFPAEADVDGDGIVYGIRTEEQETYVDGDEYFAWRDAYIGGAETIELTFSNLSKENIDKLKYDGNN